MWIAASCGTLDRSPWLYRFLIKLLEGDPETIQLLVEDPWKESLDTPKFICIDAYNYSFRRNPAKALNLEKAPYWDRKFLRRVYPPKGGATLESLKEEIPTNRPI